MLAGKRSDINSWDLRTVRTGTSKPGSVQAPGNRHPGSSWETFLFLVTAPWVLCFPGRTERGEDLEIGE